MRLVILLTLTILIAALGARYLKPGKKTQFVGLPHRTEKANVVEKTKPTPAPLKTTQTPSAVLGRRPSSLAPGPVPEFPRDDFRPQLNPNRLNRGLSSSSSPKLPDPLESEEPSDVEDEDVSANDFDSFVETREDAPGDKLDVPKKEDGGSMFFSNVPSPFGQGLPPTTPPPSVTKNDGKSKPKKPKKNDNGTDDGDPDSETVPVLTTDTCTAVMGSGTYPQAITVTLSCTGGLTPRYCLGEGSCCAPNSGITYTAPVTFGEDDTTYCLSVQGVSSTKYTDVSSFRYDFVLGAPEVNLTLSDSKTWYQTTELHQNTFQVESDRFGVANNFVGSRNLLTNDPGPAGLNTSCGEFQTEYLTYSPTPVEVLAPLSTLPLTVGTPLDVFLRPVDLDYGENFIVTYVEDQTVGAESFGCSTTKITLHDFPYFHHDVAHGADGTNQGRTFSASFVSYGHFEAPSDLFSLLFGRGKSSSGGFTLSSGLFAIFH